MSFQLPEQVKEVKQTINRDVPFLCFLFVELKKFKRYQIVMTSYNIVGESPPSTPAEVSVGEAGEDVVDSVTAHPVRGCECPTGCQTL